jgi:tRNA threonylcarbamoyladenosine biosynthesis protein TsaB
MGPPGGSARHLVRRRLIPILVLAIETSTPRTTVALGTERGLLGSVLLQAGPAGHELILPAVDQIVRWTDAKMSSVGGVAVGLGPGLFTGMRVGIATGKTLAQALDVPIVGLASLDVLALSAQRVRRLICSTVDAKRGEVFHAFYRPVHGGVARETPFAVSRPEALTAELIARREDILVVGTGGPTYRSTLQEAGTHVEIETDASYPGPAELVHLAVARLQREDYDRPLDLEPIYLRKSDAEINWERRRSAG